MLLEHMTSPDAKEAAEKGLVAVLPIGSTEVHGPHMPLGTDAIVAHELARRAAEKEEAVVLPPLYYGFVQESAHFPGTVSLSAKTLLTMIEEVCNEAARNGFKKILIVNGHGGNSVLLRTFMRTTLRKKKNYVLYAMIDPWAGINELAAKLSEGRLYGHACEIETSIGLHLYGSHVKMSNVKREGKLGSTGLPKGIETPFDWQAYALDVYVGDPRHATKEKGKILVDKMVEYLAEAIKAIRNDAVVPKVLDEYYRKAYNEK